MQQDTRAEGPHNCPLTARELAFGIPGRGLSKSLPKLSESFTVWQQGPQEVAPEEIT